VSRTGDVATKSPARRRPQARAVATREQIVAAAISCFSRLGFEGATTRLIAEQAGVNQGLITHHFSSKEQLWKAAVDQLFATVEDDFERRAEALEDADPPMRVRLMIRFFVRFASRHPEQLRFMMQEGLTAGPRMKWLVERHLSKAWTRLRRMLAVAREEDILVEGSDAHVFYALVGAASTIYALAAECEHLTGIDPTSDDQVEAHARLVESMLLRGK
jgi:TetR/AcrR family transcriptional regulator